jgi:hypothetical protein
VLRRSCVHLAGMQHVWEKSAYRFWVEKTSKKETTEKIRRRWEDNIKMDLREIELECGMNSHDSG